MTLQKRLQTFLTKNKLKVVHQIAHGFCAQVFLVQTKNGQRCALKIERDKSPRRDFVRKESTFLRAANHVHVGPKLLQTDFENKAILMEFIDGCAFYKWIFEYNLPRKKLQKCVNDLLAQAQRLDATGLDHGQLAGRGANILVTQNGKPIIIDFEKSSMTRRVHNLSQLESFLFKNPHSRVTRRVTEILKQKEKKK